MPGKWSVCVEHNVRAVFQAQPDASSSSGACVVQWRLAIVVQWAVGYNSWHVKLSAHAAAVCT